MGHPPETRSDVVTFDLPLVPREEVLGYMLGGGIIIIRNWPARTRMLK
ncbi:hypothetical protein NX02_12255 [Sphingomonas sanxanigenens DSM 19645 = NX02]|uniref:Uncharacterized protein n=1 Tax=Sphingomonas sanxanigenens DSM 19645 = NX02 TaxID=1123269 RepID=W0ACY5_9SPHN|nr:hypothetical protein NX02_12255 [Sphingomonas sanxanigenens DSM 19645 = NX02]